MRRHLPGRSRGVTLVETTIAMTIMAFIMGFTGFLIFMSARNAYNVNVQIQSQTNAGNAADNATALLRDAVCFAHWPADSSGTTATLSRVRFVMPGPKDSITTQVLCFNPAKKRVEYYVSEKDVQFVGTHDGLPVPHGTPTTSWPGIARALFHWENEYRLTLIFSFEYSGFALKPTGQDNLQFGQFITDVIARNHFMDEGVENYAAADNVSSSPATL